MAEPYSVQILVQVLNKVLMPGTQISDEHIIHLVKYITGMPENCIDRKSLYKILSLWLLETVDLWINELPQPAILTLALNIAVFVSSEEEHFVELNKRNVIERFIKIIKLALHNIDATPDVGYIRFMSCFLRHHSGTLWMIGTSYWTEILTLARSPDKGFLIEGECIKFVSKLISESSNIHPGFCSKLIYMLLSPIVDVATVAKKNNKVNVEEFNKNCLPSLRVFQSALEIFLDEISKGKSSIAYNQIVATIEKLSYEKYVLDICQVTSNDDICYNLINLLFLMCVFDLYSNTKNTPLLTYPEFVPVITKFEFIRKTFCFRYLKMFPKIVFSWVIYNSKIGNQLPRVLMRDGTIITFEDSLIFYQLLPAVYVSFNFFGHSDLYLEPNDELRDKLVTESLKKLLPEVFYHLYQFRDYMENIFSFEYSISSIDYVLRSKKYYSRNQANMALKILICCFEDFNKIIAIDSDAVMADDTKTKYLHRLMDAIKIIIMTFDLNWRDALESITLMEITLTILSMSGWSSEVIVNGLELISVAFSKHLSLNMAFLTDQFDGDVIEKIIEICIQKMNNESNEIRSSAIKVIESISNNVNKDFSSFKPLILENYLPVRIFEMAVHDQDPNVRAAAVRCLQEMASVEDFWNYILQSYDIYDQVCQTLFEEYHHIVRSETATLVAIIYQQHDFSPELLMKFYDTMSYTATEDTHPSVRRNALQYWKNVIQNHLSLQGMIDGAFPDVTFSKESRKIVILNDIAVKKRLVKVLYQLSETGCLAVLKTSLEDADEEVRKTSKDIVSDFYDLLTKYEVIIHDIDCYEPARCRDSFCDTNDILEKELNCKLKGRNILQPEIFLDFVKTYFMPNQSTAEACQRPIIETVLKEILCDNYSHGLS